MLELKQIVKDYPAGNATVHALKGVDLRFRTSEFVSILGPSGCGKTTLLNIIGGLDQYTSGDLVIDGISTKDYKDRDWDTYRNHSIGFVFQTYNLIPHQTVLKNVELALTLAGVPKSERRERAAKALERVGLGDQLNKRPNQMSGGQMQRVAIARALVNNPDIILADEPTGALDTETGLQVMELLKEVAQDRLVVMVTHNPELAEKYSSRIIRILDGVLVGDTAPMTEEEYKAEKAAESDKQQEEFVCEAAETKSQALDKEAYDGDKESLADVAPKNNTAEHKKTKQKRKKKSSMSFWTAFKLSLTNLFTKKGRTFLTSFAGSIGIIGIALILSVSQGMTQYIKLVQEQTLTTYPLTIQSTAMDLSSIVATMMSNNEKHDDRTDSDKVYQRSIVENVAKLVEATSGSQNDLKTFKQFLEKEVADENSKLHGAIAGLQYQYNLNLNIFCKNNQNKIQEINPRDMLTRVITSQLGSGAQSAMGGYYASMTTFSVNIFQELLPALDGSSVNPLLYDQYDKVYGEWPKAYNEVVLIMNEDNEISDIALYALGILGDDYIDDVVALINGEITEEELDSRKGNWSYADMCNTECVLLLSSDLYMQSSDGTWKDIRKDETQLELIYNNADKAIPLKITGIIRPNKDATAHMLNGTVGYTSALTEHVVNEALSSPAVQEQQKNTTTDIFTGLPFSANKDNLSTSEKVTAFREYFESLSFEEKVDAYGEMLCTDNSATIEQSADNYLAFMQSGGSESFRSNIADMMLQQPSFADYTKEEVLENLSYLTDEQIVALIRPSCVEIFRARYKNTCIQELQKDDRPEDEQLAIINAYLQSDDRTDEQLAAYYDEIVVFSDSTWENNMAKLGWVDLDTPAVINIYASSFDAKDVIAEEIARYNSEHDEAQQITYTDFVALIMSAVTTIINAITYVLIAFVSISLIVSSIMIGVITLISVQERTKEIGILRAIGASKRDVSSMFNAETVIIGFAAGLIGVVFTYILCIPVNAILHALTGISTLSAYLPPVAALILIAISMLLTLISGLIPSRSAAKKDPVVALRTE